MFIVTSMSSSSPKNHCGGEGQQNAAVSQVDWNRDSSIGTATGLAVVLRLLAGARNLSIAHGPALGPTQSPILWVPGVKRLRREAASSVAVKNAVSIGGGGSI
jgi:hypothetical protein